MTLPPERAATDVGEAGRASRSRFALHPAASLVASILRAFVKEQLFIGHILHGQELEIKASSAFFVKNQTITMHFLLNIVTMARRAASM